MIVIVVIKAINEIAEEGWILSNLVKLTKIMLAMANAEIHLIGILKRKSKPKPTDKKITVEISPTNNKFLQLALFIGIVTV